MEMKDYTVLTGGRFVAGIRNPGKGKTIRLTELQAEHPLRTLDIELPGTEVAAPKSDPAPGAETEKPASAAPKAATPPAA